jgi:hypothetical protein
MALVHGFGALAGSVGAYVVGSLNGSLAVVFTAVTLPLAALFMLGVPHVRVRRRRSAAA